MSRNREQLFREINDEGWCMQSIGYPASNRRIALIMCPGVDDLMEFRQAFDLDPVESKLMPGIWVTNEIQRGSKYQMTIVKHTTEPWAWQQFNQLKKEWMRDNHVED